MYLLYNTPIPPASGVVNSCGGVGANISNRAGFGPAVVGVFNS